jgi:hypothetical protein
VSPQVIYGLLIRLPSTDAAMSEDKVPTIDRSKRLQRIRVSVCAITMAAQWQWLDDHFESAVGNCSADATGTPPWLVL